MPSRRYLFLERAFLAAVCAAVAAGQRSRQGLFIAAFVVVTTLGLLHHRRQELLFAYAAVFAEIASVWLGSFWLQRWLRAVAIGGALLGILGSVVFPLPDFTVLHGTYKTIGCYTTRLGGVDCRIFYPSSYRSSSLDAKRRVPYVYTHHGEHLKRGLSIVGKAPQWFFNTFDSAFLSAISGAPVLPNPVSSCGWPLIIFSHGLGGSMEIYSAILQEIVSQGNIVVVVNHCDGSASVTRHGDGSVHLIQSVSPEVAANSNGEGFRFRNRQLAQRVREVRDVLDAITHAKNFPSEHPALLSIDLGNVHIAGHSFGAATALSAAHVDDRFQSAILHDAFMMPVSEDHKNGLGNRVPVLHIISEQFLLHRHENVEAIKRHARGCSHPRTGVFVLKSSHHNDFTDLPRFSPLVTRLMAAAGSVDPVYAGKAVGQLSAAFTRGELASELDRFHDVVPVM